MTGDPDPAALAEALSSFLADHDDGEDALTAVLAVDDDSATWDFGDIPLDSGTFGELVSRGIVVKHDGAYRLADPETTRAILAGGSVPRESSSPSRSRDWSLPSVDPSAAVGLFVALLVVAGARMTAFSSAFQAGYRISPANDPYYFRYWLEQLLAASAGVGDVSVLVEPPAGVAARRPMAHATNWLLAELLGGSQWAAETVAMWFPVLGSVALGALVYALAVVLTRDVRVGIASVLVLAVTPIHAVYTGLGFIDHNVHQYLWLGLTLLSAGWLAVAFQRTWRADEMASLATDATVLSAVSSSAFLRRPLTWAIAGVLGLSVAFGTHAWGGSPLLLFPLAAYVALRIAQDVRAGADPVVANLPLLGGLALGSALSLLLHVGWGWHSRFVALTPLLVFCGAVAVTGFGALWARLEIDIRGLLALEGGVAFVVLVAFRLLRPADWAAATARLDDLFFRAAATETGSLFSLDYFVLFGPLYQLGMEFYIALAALLWVGRVVSRRYEPGWLLVGTYSAYLLVLASIQVRFAGQLAIPMAILGGLGIVYLLSAVELARPPVIFGDDGASDGSTTSPGPTMGADAASLDPSIVLPPREKVAYVVGIGLLIFGLSLIYVPGLTAQTTYSDAEVDALAAIDTHAETAERSYPETYVLSEWGENRMYNHFVSGESESYGYAQGTYGDFQTSEDPDGWFDEFDGRVGYVVVTEIPPDYPPESTQRQLLGGLGAGANGTAPLAHYQLLTVDGAHSAAAFAVVPGATLTAPAEAGQQVTVSTSVEVDAAAFTYERTATVGSDGRVSVTVPYPGTYTVDGESVTVSEAAVLEGRTVSLGSS